MPITREQAEARAKASRQSIGPAQTYDPNSEHGQRITEEVNKIFHTQKILGRPLEQIAIITMNPDGVKYLPLRADAQDVHQGVDKLRGFDVEYPGLNGAGADWAQGFVISMITSKHYDRDAKTIRKGWRYIFGCALGGDWERGDNVIMENGDWIAFWHNYDKEEEDKEQKRLMKMVSETHPEWKPFMTAL